MALPPIYDNPKSQEVSAEPDPRDFTDRNNTKLSSKDEARYDEWVNKQSERIGRDISKDLYDYDIRGLFKGLDGKDIPKGHGPDTHKKPNHPTFSDESDWHGKDGNAGGSWGKKDGKDVFKPGKTNLEHYRPEELRGYFDKVEPDVMLDMPAADQGES